MIEQKPVAVVGLGSILPDAANPTEFWNNLQAGRYSIRETPANRWRSDLYYHPDPKMPDKTYSKIGGWVEGFQLQPAKLGIPIPPNVLAVMDLAQQWGIAASHQALTDAGYPQRPLDNERVAVILGNVLGGENHYRTTLRIMAPEYQAALAELPEFQGLPVEIQQTLLRGMAEKIYKSIPGITEDTMPGELGNVIAGRVANLFNFGGPNYITDAACASSLAALLAAVDGLNNFQFDAVLTGGVDHSMGVEGFVKFSKIGALSPDGSRPYSEGANGFVMGEGAAILLLKRLEDAERAGDKIYAVIRGIGSSSDGKGKGITAPNPIGQKRAIERAWKNCGLSPASAGMIEGHGTSTRVGDVVEVNSLASVFGGLGIPTGQIALGSVKSNIGHLKAAAGAAGLLKAVLALHHKVIPPSVNVTRPNPDIAFDQMPFRVNTELCEWERPVGEIRRAGLSSFGFGGTNFHIVVEEYVPGMHTPAAPVFSGVQVGAAVEAEDQNQPAQVIHVIVPASTAQNAPMLEPQPVMAVQPEPAAVKTPVADAAQPVVAAAALPDAESIKTFVLGLVSEKTGYPPEMLDLELDLEADLGVDTVKQAELFFAVRENYGIPRREDLRLSDYNTLTKVIGFVTDALADRAAAQPVAAVQPQPEPVMAASEVTVQEPSATIEPSMNVARETGLPNFYRGLLFLSAETAADLREKTAAVLDAARSGSLPAAAYPTAQQLALPERLAVDYNDAPDLVKRLEKALKTLDAPTPVAWQALASQGICRGSGAPGKVAFLFPGQGSQYVNMLRDLAEVEPLAAEIFREADAVMTPLLGKPLTEFIFADADPESVARAEAELKNTQITQPAVLTANIILMRLMNKFGFRPDMVIGHSLGEYAALVAAGVLSFGDALEVVSARGRAMSQVSLADNGCMAAVSGPLETVEEILKTIPGYVVIANINSPIQSVIAGETPAVEAAVAAFVAQGIQAVKIPVSHAFHSRIVAPASQPLRNVIAQMQVNQPALPIAANVTGNVYPNDRDAILDMLAAQVASPVQFIRGIQTLSDLGARVFVESGPKRVLCALTGDILKGREDVQLLASNHPRKGGLVSFNEALCGLFAAGVQPIFDQPQAAVSIEQSVSSALPVDEMQQPVAVEPVYPVNPAAGLTGSVVISGAGVGLPGQGRSVFADDNIQRLLKGEQLIEPLNPSVRDEMIQKRVTRLVKSDAGAVMVAIDELDQTIKLAGQRGAFDPNDEFGIPAERLEAVDISTQLAIAAGIEALRDAGIPLVMNYRQTRVGSYLPDRWKLPEALADETGVIFCSAFPGLDRMAEESERYYRYQHVAGQIVDLSHLLEQLPAGESTARSLLAQRLQELQLQAEKMDYHFDRRFIFRVLAMGHSQFAEYIGARGPNTHVNAACASTTHAVSVAEDWIRAGRCRRVVIIAGDDVTGGSLSGWIAPGMLASGASTTEGDLRLAALPFDRRRNGMIMGMGAAALVVEAEDAVRERGVTAIAEVLSAQIANSAFHGTRLDVNHVSQVMDRLVSQAEQRFGVQRHEMAAETVFVSHETYTPARGGSASAEICALRRTFGDQASQVVIANTKGFTGHTMGVGVEDVIAVKALEFGIVPPVANLNEQFEPDPDLGDLNLSRGGEYPVRYALRLGAGFGSQIAMTLLRKVQPVKERINRTVHQRWLAEVSGYAEPEL